MKIWEKKGNRKRNRKAKGGWCRQSEYTWEGEGKNKSKKEN